MTRARALCGANPVYFTECRQAVGDTCCETDEENEDMNKRFLKSVGRLAAGLVLVVGMSMASLGCCEKCGKTTQCKQAKACCAKSCDKKCDAKCQKKCDKKCTKSAKATPCSGHSVAKKCPPGCTQPCCKKAEGKKCPPGCTKPCCKKT